MRVLVVGASGFIGRNFILKSSRGWEIFAVFNQSRDFLKFLEINELTNVLPCKCDLRNSKEVQKTFATSGQDFDVCLYTAGNSDIGLSVREPMFDLDSNVRSLLNLINCIKVKKFIYMSSGSVYLGNRGPVSDASPVAPTVPYGVSKLSSELYIKFFQQHSDCLKEYVILRFFGAYGPWELERKIYTNLINVFYLNNRNEYTLKGDGSNYIDAMYVDDAVTGILKVVESSKANLTVDFCRGDRLTVNDLVIRVGKILGKDKITINHQGHAAEYIDFYASPEKMEKIFAFRPKITLEEGITKFSRFLEAAAATKI